MLRRAFLAAAVLAAAALPAQAQPVPGQPAPAFTLTDLDGRKVALADLKGKYVVLEWTNPSCPFVQKHYDSGNMQSLQKRFTAEGVQWIVVNSTSASHSEYVKPAEQKAWLAKHGAAASIAALDADGTVSRAYAAKVTPHMYVIDPNGVLVYAGAIDDKRSANPADVKSARNYVTQAFAELRAGKPVSSPSTQAYGCTIKY
ncbi:MAG: redoxin domain-containing protein [Burkholderiaceae bacterium]|jgi:peroxiredoxin|nr:redoxin domain-containing protein [Burkholderiaceae bacterium]